MDVKYCIFQVYKHGIFGSVKFLGNAQIYWIPTPNNKVYCFDFFGTYKAPFGGTKYILRHLITVDFIHVDKALSSIVDSNNGKYIVMEEIPAKVEADPTNENKILIKLNHFGKYFKSNIVMEYSREFSSYYRQNLYVVDANFVMESEEFIGDTSSRNKNNILKSKTNVYNNILKDALKNKLTKTEPVGTDLTK